MLRKTDISSLLIVIILALQLTMSLFLKFSQGDRNLFPFYAWDLFFEIPNRVRIYAIQITEVEGEKINPPMLISEVNDVTFDKKVVNFNPDIDKKSVKFYTLIQNLGSSLKKNHFEESQKYQQLIENNYFGDVTKYQLVLLRYDDPIENYKTGSVAVDIIKEFSVTK